MNLFSDERANELRQLFFESAQELLLSLNEGGLALEKEPTNPEIIKSIRRTVHTLKGDSAACGYHEMSELAHAVEDVITPAYAESSGPQLAELILNVADVFDGMLSAYGNNIEPPADDFVRALIAAIVTPQGSAAPNFAPKFEWSEYELLVVKNSEGSGKHVFEIALNVDPQCPMRSAALQLIRNVMQEIGTIVVIHPEDDVDVPSIIEAVLSTYHEREWIEKKCKVPGIVSALLVRERIHQEDAVATPVIESTAGMLPVSDTEADVLGILEPTGQSTVSSSADKRPAKSGGEARLAAATENLLRVDAERIDNVLDQVGGLIIGKSILVEILNEFSREFPKHPLRGRISDAIAFQSQILGKLQRSVMKIRMVPVEQLFRRFPRVLRDAAKHEQKEVELILEGESTDLDKSILDALAEPLAHLVRNAVAHGIESPQERRLAGKQEIGTVRLNAYHQGNQVIIEVSDDGRGINREAIVKKALEKGILDHEESVRLKDNESLDLLFHSGFTTRERVTEIAGRGVGLDVVRSVIERLKGHISIQTEPGQGTTFQLRLPLTLAIIKALLFRVKKRLYSVPLGSVVEINRAYEREIHVVDNHEVLQIREELLTLVRLTELAESEGENNITSPPSPSHKVFIISVAVGHRKFGLVVDQLVGEQELVIKAIDDKVFTSQLVSGASVLGDGRVVLILNIAAVVEKIGRSASMQRIALA